MRLEHIELERLSVSPANMRAKRPPNIEGILPSVRKRGVLVPLLVRPNGGDTFEIVAGRRRFLAAKAVAEEQGQRTTLPCGILAAGDDAAALEASLIENLIRLDPDEVTQWETFTRLVKEGRDVEDIAATFGITERLVRRVLALGNLLPRIRSLYRQEKIDAGTLRHLTLATKTQQRDWLTLYDSRDSYAPTGHSLKEWLFGGLPVATKAALFDLADYTGPIVSDLFGEDSYFADADAFWALQNQAVEARRQAFLKDGWSAVEVLEPGNHFQRWEYEKRSKAKGGKVYIAVSARGDVEFHEGWLPMREARRRDGEQSGAAPPGPEITSAMRNYLDLHRHAAVRAGLVDYPDLALRLMLAHAITSSTLWSVRPDRQRTDNEAIAASVTSSPSEALFGERRQTVLALLGFDAEQPTVVGGGSLVDTGDLFHRLVSLSSDDVLSIAAIVMGETLAVGDPIVETLGVHLAVNAADAWQADDAFFGLIRDRAVLISMVAEVAGTDVARANAGAAGKVLKAIIRDCLAGHNGRAKVERWVPAWMRFPAQSYRAQNGASQAPAAEAA